MSRKVLSVLLILALVLSGVCAFAEADKTVIQFYFPVQLGGAAANMIEQFVGEFEQRIPILPWTRFSAATMPTR